MKDFDILKPDRIDQYQEAQDRKEITYVGSARCPKGLRPFGFLNGEIFQIPVVSKARMNLNDQISIHSKATLKSGTRICFALNKRNAAKKFKKIGLI